MAAKNGRGEEWVLSSARPWDPSLADNGKEQARAAAKRLRGVLTSAGLRPVCRIYTSPLWRCVETADLLAEEFDVKSLLVEEGLVETLCEGWMRQWAVPGADSKWGGPPGAAMPEGTSHKYGAKLEGPIVDEANLRKEALAGPEELLLTAWELKGMGWVRVDVNHYSQVQVRNRPVRWGNFETKAELAERIEQTVRSRVAEHPGETLVFVSHGGPTGTGFSIFAQRDPPKGSGGMTALSVLSLDDPENTTRNWEVHLANDAEHGKVFAKGDETRI